MDFEFFELLSPEEAQKYLDNYLREEKKAVETILPDIEHDGIKVDFTVESIPPVMKWILKKLRLVKVRRKEKLPQYIVDSGEDPDWYLDLDDQSKVWVLRASYYMGESFVRSFDCLSWSTGDTEYIQQNMPIVTGFDHGLEMAAIMVTKNIYMGILEKINEDSRIDTTIKHWILSIT